MAFTENRNDGKKINSKFVGKIYIFGKANLKLNN